MINSFTNHMELFDFTLWNKRWILQTWKEREMKSIESLNAAFTLDQPLDTQFQLQLKVLRASTTIANFKLFLPQQTQM